MYNPRVIVLTLNWNGKHLLDDFLTSFRVNDYLNFEVVVIDNGSTDGSEEFVKENFPGVKTIRNSTNLGYSAGFNVGLDYSFNQENADFVLITNNDVVADKHLISSLIETALTDPMIGFTIGKVYFHDKPDIFQTVGKKEHPVRLSGEHIGAREKDSGQYDLVEERAFCDDIYWLISRDLYKKTGGYDTTFFLQAEDFDWQMRAKEIGYKIMYTPNARLWHKDSMTLGKSSPKKAYYDARNPFIVILKHQSPEFIKQYFWDMLRQQMIKPSIKLLIRRLAFKKVFKMWQGFFSAWNWGVRNNKISLRRIL